MWQLPNTIGVDGSTPVDWNIVVTDHNVRINTDAVIGRERQVLGLIVNTNTLTVDGDNASNTGNGLTVSHYLELNSKIDLQGESQLIQPTGSDLLVGAAGALERDQQGTADTFTYNYWSAPVGMTDIATNNYSYFVQDIIYDGLNPVNFSSLTLDGSPTTPITIADYWIWKFANNTSDAYSEWQHVRQTSSILPGEGFTMKGPGTGGITDPQNYTFLGKPNNAAITLNINGGNDYLVGNPYPSAIDADEFINDNPALNGTLYFWEHWGGGSHILKEYEGGYALYTLAGGVPAPAPDPDVAQVGTGTMTPGQYIPVSQGFFVTGDSNGTITFENDQRIFIKEGSSSSVFVRNANANASKQHDDQRMKIRLGFKASNALKLRRELLLTIDPLTSNGVDWAYDAPLLEDQQTDDIYWRIDNNKFIIQASDDNSTSAIYPIGVKTSVDGINTFGINALEHVPSDTEIYLHDKALGLYHNLRDSDYQIFLNAGEYNERFEVTFATAQVLNIDDSTAQHIDVLYANDSKEIVLINPNNITVKRIALFNMLGQEVLNIKDIAQSNNAKYKADTLSTGAYIIKLYTQDNAVINKKVIVK